MAVSHAEAASHKKTDAAQKEEPLSRSARTKTHAMPAAARSDTAQTASASVSAGQKKTQRRPLLKILFKFLHKSPKSSSKKEANSSPEQNRTKWTPQEERMLANIAELHAARVRDIMIPRSDIEALELNKTLAEALHLFEQSGHSRMPVYAETLDEPRGMIHIRDILSYITHISLPEAQQKEPMGENSGKSSKNKRKGSRARGAAQKSADYAPPDFDVPISKLGIIRDVLFVPASMQAGRLLARMQAGRMQMALVIDEHGGTDGLVSMEDVVELIVGNIEDEHDDEDADIVAEAQNSWIIDGATELEELKENLGIDFSEHPLAQEVDTIGGLIITTLDRIPARGEKVPLSPQYRIQILDADRRRIKRIRMNRTETAAKT